MAIRINIGPYLVAQLGAYIQTDLSAVVSINGIPTGVVALVGLAEKGPVSPREFTDFASVLYTYGSGPLVDFAKAAFIGGAGRLTLVRAGAPHTAALSMRILEEPAPGQLGLFEGSLPFVAPEAGAGYNGVLFNSYLIDGGSYVLTAPSDMVTVPEELLGEGVQNPVTLNLKNEKYIITITHKQRGGNEDQDVFTIPAQFARRTVLIRRGERLSFAPEWIETHSHYPVLTDQMLSEVAVDAQGAVSQGLGFVTPLEDIAAQLKDFLQAEDSVQIFEAGERVPVGLVLYELQYGNLFGNSACRFMRVPVDDERSLFEQAPWFGSDENVHPFYGEYLDAEGETRTVFNVYVDKIATRKNGARDVLPGFRLYAQTDGSVMISTTVYPEIEGVQTAVPATLKDLALHNAAISAKHEGKELAGTFHLDHYYKFIGGSNGDDGTGFYTKMAGAPGYTTAWTKALKTLEQEEVNFIVPAYRFLRDTTMPERIEIFAAIIGTHRAHVETMSNLVQRKRRCLVFGFPAARPAERIDQDKFMTLLKKTVPGLAGDSDRSQLWVDSFATTVIDGQRTLYGGEMLAPYVAGQHANLPPYRSITFRPVGGMFEEGTKYDWTYANKDRLIGLRVGFIEKYKTIGGAQGIRFHHNPTTWMGSANRGYQEFVLRRIDDYVSEFVYRNLEEAFIGRESRGKVTEQEMKRYTEKLLGQLVNGPIVAYRDVRVKAGDDKTVYYVDFYVQPVTEIKFIPIVMKVTFDLA